MLNELNLRVCYLIYSPLTIILLILTCTDNHFEPTFTVTTKSHYRKECSFRTNLYQKRVLQVAEVNNENEPAAQEMILEENPCHMTGVFFTGIDIFGSVSWYLILITFKFWDVTDKNSGGDIDLVECNNPAKCVVEYKTSNDGMHIVHEDNNIVSSCAMVVNYYQGLFIYAGNNFGIWTGGLVYPNEVLRCLQQL